MVLPVSIMTDIRIDDILNAIHKRMMNDKLRRFTRLNIIVSDDITVNSAIPSAIR